MVVGICLVILCAKDDVDWVSRLDIFRNARLEMYRVVWPTKQEIGQTTLMVVVFVCVVALFFGVLTHCLLGL